jgi:hypothetical protein
VNDPRLSVHDEVIIIESDRRDLMELVVAFRGTPYRVTAVESVAPLRAAREMAPRSAAALIIKLDGKENVVEVRGLIESCTGTRLLFLVPDMPPSAAIARMVRASGGALLAASEAGIVIVATLIGMLSDYAVLPRAAD